MSLSRQGVRLRKYSLLPSRKIRRVSGDLVVSHLDARRAQVVFVHVAERQRHFGHAHRLASVGAVENHVGHFAAAQSLGRLLAEHPADGIGDVGFAAAVGADDGGDTGLEIQRGFVREGLKPQNC